MQYLSFVFSRIFLKRMMNNIFFAKPCILIVKKLFPLQFVKNVWFYICVFKLSSFPKNKFFMQYYLNWWKKWKKKCLPKLANCIFAITSFDLWMSKGVHDIFFLSLISLDLIDNLNKWLLVYLRQQKLMVKS